MSNKIFSFLLGFWSHSKQAGKILEKHGMLVEFWSWPCTSAGTALALGLIAVSPNGYGEAHLAAPWSAKA